MSTQLYDKAGNQLFPVIEGDDISITWGEGKEDLSKVLEQIYFLAEDGSEEGSASSSLEIVCKYTTSTISNTSAIKDVTDWGDTFVQPTDEKPYSWKKTEIRLAGLTKSTFYEIVASAIQDKTLTIYITQSNTENPSFDDSIYDDPEYQTDSYVPAGWNTFPKSVTATLPYLYTSSRDKEDGKWGRYKIPALLTNWSYESITKFYFAITDELAIPELDNAASDPNSYPADADPYQYEWKLNIQEDFTGYLWMISATFVDGTLRGNWSVPTLISIVK